MFSFPVQSKGEHLAREAVIDGVLSENNVPDASQGGKGQSGKSCRLSFTSTIIFALRQAGKLDAVLLLDVAAVEIVEGVCLVI